MSTDQLLYPMEFQSHEEEWLEFESLFQMPSGYLGSNSTSADSISPQDSNQSFTDADFLNWGSDPALYSQAMFPDFAGLEASVEGLDHSTLNFQPFINPNDVLQPAQYPPQSAEPGFANSCVHDGNYASAFRYMVESQAALDTRCFSQKEKRRDASIALHLQRMQNAPPPDLSTPSLSSMHLSSPNWSESSLDFTSFEGSSNTTPAPESHQSTPPSATEPGVGSMQLVLDLNMNTAANVPRKQKPRSKAQRENYINARKYGVCEKHRKQHKRCNCLEKAAAAHLNANGSRADANTIAYQQTNHERIVVSKSQQHCAQSSTSSVGSGLARSLPQPVRVPQPDLSPTRRLVSPGGDQSTVKQTTGLRRSLVRVPRPDVSLTQPLASTNRDKVTVRKTVKLQKSNVSSAQPVQTIASSTGDTRSSSSYMGPHTSHNRATLQSAPLLMTSRGSLNIPARYKDKDSQSTNTQKSRLRVSDSRRTPRQLANTQAAVGSCGSSNVLQVQNQIAGAISRRSQTARTPGVGLLQGARLVSAFANFIFGHFAILASNICAGALARTTTTGLQLIWQNSRTLTSGTSSAGSVLRCFAIVSSRIFIQSRRGMGLL